MNWSDDWRARRSHRRERIRKVVFGDTPRPSRLERILLVFAIVATAFICYYFRLVKAREFEVIGIAEVVLYFVLRRAWWKHKMGQGEKP
jgi:hypothetical protein